MTNERLEQDMQNLARRQIRNISEMFLPTMHGNILGQQLHT
jgi:hypothetical protein